MALKRVRGLAAVCANGVAAGIIDSSRGSDTTTPAPLRNVRRERCFFVINDIGGLLISTIASLWSGTEHFLQFQEPMKKNGHHSLMHPGQSIVRSACRCNPLPGQARKSAFFPLPS